MLIVVRMSSCWQTEFCHVFLCVAECLVWSVICDQSEQLLLNTTMTTSNNHLSCKLLCTRGMWYIVGQAWACHGTLRGGCNSDMPWTVIKGIRCACPCGHIPWYSLRCEVLYCVHRARSYVLHLLSLCSCSVSCSLLHLSFSSLVCSYLRSTLRTQVLHVHCTKTLCFMWHVHVIFCEFGIGYLQKCVFTVRHMHTYRQTRVTFNTSVWGSLRLAPINTLLGCQNEYALKKEVLLSEQTYLKERVQQKCPTNRSKVGYKRMS